jgi:hypothetical protein
METDARRLVIAWDSRRTAAEFRGRAEFALVLMLLSRNVAIEAERAKRGKWPCTFVCRNSKLIDFSACTELAISAATGSSHSLNSDLLT